MKRGEGKRGRRAVKGKKKRITSFTMGYKSLGGRRKKNLYPPGRGEGGAMLFPSRRRGKKRGTRLPSEKKKERVRPSSNSLVRKRRGKVLTTWGEKRREEETVAFFRGGREDRTFHIFGRQGFFTYGFANHDIGLIKRLGESRQRWAIFTIFQRRKTAGC